MQINPGEKLVIGQQGEILAREFEFDISCWVGKYGPGTPQMLIRRNGDTFFYPVELTVRDSKAIWQVSESDTEKKGFGEYQLLYYAGGRLVKSIVSTFYVNPSADPSGPTPPEPQQGWVEQVLAAGTQAAESAESAAASAQNAALSQQSAEQAAETATGAQTAAEAAAEQAGDYAAQTTEQASTAQQSATAAAQSEANAGQSAADAAESEATVQALVDRMGNVPVVASTEFEADAETVTHKSTTVNIKTGETGVEEAPLPVANTQQAGVMTAETVQAIMDLTAQVATLSGQNARLSYTAGATPTAAEVEAFVISKGYTDPTRWEYVAVVVRASKHVWRYYTGTGWQDDGIDTVGQATEYILGVVLGSSTDGKVYVEADGTMSLNGYDAIMSELENLSAGKADDSDVYHEWRLSYNATTQRLTKNGVEVPFADVYAAVEDKSKYVYVEWSNRVYIPQYVSGGLLYFMCAYIDSGLIKLERIMFDSATGKALTATLSAYPTTQVYTKNEITGLLAEKQNTLTFDTTPTEGSENPVTSGGVYTAVDGLNQSLAQKLTEPSGAQVGQFFRVASIDKDGHYVLEATPLPISGIEQHGLVGIRRNSNGLLISNGLLGLDIASEIYMRQRSNVHLINARSIDYAAKTALSAPIAASAGMIDGVYHYPAWTAEEQAAAQERIGILSSEGVLF